MSPACALAVAALVAAATPAQAAAPATTPATAPKLTLDPFDAPSASSRPATAPADPNDISLLPLEALMEIEVFSVSKHKESIQTAPAAVAVITAEDIKHSGMQQIAELLRMAPGVHVGQVSANQWVVGSRGFSTLYNSNLLVLMDGRTVYTPLFAGVYWDTVDYVLNDIDHIEVIRGPGATLWGANAVNGVINITTKSAKDTQGLYVSDYTGTDGYIGSVRYGGKVDDKVFYRVYAKYRTMDDYSLANGSDAWDGWDSTRGGFRVDAELSERDRLTVQGDLYATREGDLRRFLLLAPPLNVDGPYLANDSGANMLARWTHELGTESEFTLQVYYDRLNRNDTGQGYTQDTYDLDFSHRFRLGDAHEITWGGGYRLVADTTEVLLLNVAAPVTVEQHYRPSERDSQYANVFVQDDVTLIPKRLRAILGTKVEYNTWTDAEVEPSGRLLITPDERNTVWLAASRAVRTPSRWEEDNRGLLRELPNAFGLPVLGNTVGNRSFQPEHLLALEAGYRVEPAKTLSVDVSTFYNFHDNVRTLRNFGGSQFVATPFPHIDFPFEAANDAAGVSYGGEISARYRATDAWELQGSYSFINTRLHKTLPGNDFGQVRAIEASAPAHMAQLRSTYAVTKDIDVTAAVYFQSAATGVPVSGYVRGDLNVAWRPVKYVELTAGVRNLFDNQHREEGAIFARDTFTEVPRSFFLQVEGRF